MTTKSKTLVLQDEVAKGIIDFGLDIENTLRAKVEILTRGIVEFGKSLRVETDLDLKRAGKFKSGPLKDAKDVISQTFDGPLREIANARKQLLATAKNLQASKMAWSSPVLEVERLVDGAISSYLVLKELKREEQMQAIQRELSGIDDDVLEDKLQETVLEFGNDSAQVRELLDIMDMDMDVPEVSVIPSYKKEKERPDLGEDVSVRKFWKYQLVDIEKVRGRYVDKTIRKMDVRRVVTSQHMKAEELVGGIKVWFEYGSSVRGGSK